MIDEQKKPSDTERLVQLLKRAVTSAEPTEDQLFELGDSLLCIVKDALAGAVPN